MGYRSDVKIRVKNSILATAPEEVKEALNDWGEVYCDMIYITKPGESTENDPFGEDDENVEPQEIIDPNGDTTFSYYGVKWYQDDDEVKLITNWLYNLEPNIENGEVPWQFIRIGEEYDDVETEGSWDMGMYISRNIEG